jgi:hypothetical protein
MFIYFFFLRFPRRWYLETFVVLSGGKYFSSLSSDLGLKMPSPSPLYVLQYLSNDFLVGLLEKSSTIPSS